MSEENFERPTASETGRTLRRIHRIRVDKEYAELDSKKDTVPSFRAHSPFRWGRNARGWSLANGEGRNPNATYEDDCPTLIMSRPRRYSLAYVSWAIVAVVLLIGAVRAGQEWLALVGGVMVVINSWLYVYKR